MESDKVEIVLEKYFEATTTAAEEAALRDYFSGNAVAAHLERYAPMFRYLEGAKVERSTRPVQLESLRSEPIMPKLKSEKRLKSTSPESSRRLWYTWGSVAAMLLIMVAVYFSFDTASTMQSSENEYALLEEEYSKEEIAAAQEALALLSSKLNEGTEQLSHLNQFEKNTNRFLNEER